MSSLITFTDINPSSPSAKFPDIIIYRPHFTYKPHRVSICYYRTCGIRDNFIIGLQLSPTNQQSPWCVTHLGSIQLFPQIRFSFDDDVIVLENDVARRGWAHRPRIIGVRGGFQRDVAQDNESRFSWL